MTFFCPSALVLVCAVVPALALVQLGRDADGGTDTILK